MSSTVAAPVARSREGSPLLRFVGRRLLGAVVALFVASLVIFAGTQLLPGDAASVVLGRNGNPATVKLLNQQLNRVNQEIDTIDNDLSQTHPAIEKLEGER